MMCGLPRMNRLTESASASSILDLGVGRNKSAPFRHGQTQPELRGLGPAYHYFDEPRWPVGSLRSTTGTLRSKVDGASVQRTSASNSHITPSKDDSASRGDDQGACHPDAEQPPLVS